MNACNKDTQNGDLAPIELLKRIPFKHKMVVTSKTGARICKDKGLECSFFITTKDKRITPMPKTYFFRILFGVWQSMRVEKPDVIYVSSEVLPDVIPAFVLKTRCLLQGHKVKVLLRFKDCCSKKNIFSYSVIQKKTLCQHFQIDFIFAIT